MKHVGICGIGKMGAAIAGRLLASGFEVSVWNRDAAKLAPLVAKGARACATPAEVASSCDATITMLLNADALEAIYSGPNGILSGKIDGKLVIDMSTVLPSTSEKFGALVAAKGTEFLECPVGGTVGPASAGALFAFVGGADAALARARPILDKLCRRIEHVGPIGAGAKVKLATNLPLLVYWQALGESLALCQSLRLDPARLIDILSDTSGTPAIMKARGGVVAKALAGDKGEPSAFDVAAARKDLATMAALGASLGVRMAATNAALSGFEEAVKAGLSDDDATSLSILWATRPQV